MNLKTITLIALILGISTLGLLAQEPGSIYAAPAPPPNIFEEEEPQNKVYFGGHFNLSFGTITRVGIEPLIGYKLLPRFSIGAKLRYDYLREKYYAQIYDSHIYGASLFSRLMLFRGIYAHAEYAMYNYEFYDLSGITYRDWVPFLFVGGGFNQRIGPNISMNFEVLFDVLQDDRSPYSRWEPFYSIGVGVGF